MTFVIRVPKGVDQALILVGGGLCTFNSKDQHLNAGVELREPVNHLGFRVDRVIPVESRGIEQLGDRPIEIKPNLSADASGMATD